MPPPLVLGDLVKLPGDVTQNTWVGARSARDLERSLGFGAGRLSDGWCVLVLKQRLAPADFIFSGLTIRSGGRLGLPAATPEADRKRVHVMDEVIKDYRLEGAEAMKRKALAAIPENGEKRLVKVIPASPHSATASPQEQYPMGGGGLQWTLVRPCDFLVAVKVDASGIARTTRFSVFLGESADYADRAKLMKFINEA